MLIEFGSFFHFLNSFKYELVLLKIAIILMSFEKKSKILNTNLALCIRNCGSQYRFSLSTRRHSGVDGPVPVMLKGQMQFIDPGHITY